MADRPFTSASFNQFLSEGRLRGSKCQICGVVYVPPRPLCLACHSEAMEWVEMEGQGKLVAYTAVHIGPKLIIEEGYDRNNPYCTGIVELVEGPRISARILGVDARNPEGIEIGMPLRVDFLERGEGEKRRMVLAFRPGRLSP
jgi:uncharacterized OB-fold protein